MKIDFTNRNIFAPTIYQTLLDIIIYFTHKFSIGLNDSVCLEYKGRYGLLTLKNNNTGVEHLVRFVVIEVGKSSIKRIFILDIRELERDHLTRRKIIKELHDVYGYKPKFISTYLNINRSTVKRNLYDY